MSGVQIGLARTPELVAQASMLARHGSSFHFASHLLGACHGQRATRLYAFCRRVDDLVDEANDLQAAARALDALELALRTGVGGPVWLTDLRELQVETGLSHRPLLDLIEGVRRDLGEVAFQSEDDLIAYAFQVAGSVGLMMCAVLDVCDPRAYPFAIDLGIAMQLTNIARDVGADARLGRRYLPAAWVGGASAAEIRAPNPILQTQLCAASRRLLELAERYYLSGEAGLGFLPPRARLAILTAARVYRGIGACIAQSGFRSWDQRAVVSKSRKIRLAAGALITFVARPALHSRGAIHNVELHRALHALWSL